MRQRRRIRNVSDDDFQFISPDDFLKLGNQFLNVLIGVFGAIAFISLLVGGVGIMNIMLVSVTERTREIGLRMAVGANRGAVLNQFLTEAIVLTLIGRDHRLGDRLFRRDRRFPLRWRRRSARAGSRTFRQCGWDTRSAFPCWSA